MAHTYSFFGYAGFTNCDECDDDTMVNEYKRDDGLVVDLCSKCEDRLKI